MKTAVKTIAFSRWPAPSFPRCSLRSRCWGNNR